MIEPFCFLHTYKLNKLTFKCFKIPFPIIRLGNNYETQNSLKQIKQLYESVKDINVSEEYQERNLNERKKQAKQLSEFLEKYEERIDLLERRDTIEQLLRKNTQMNFQVSIQTGQLHDVDERLKELGDFDIKEALKYI